MAYYPNNLYQNYPYQGYPQMSPSLQGKVVDSVDAVKVTDIPFGSFGVFPKGDFSEVYIKSWNNNGTTQTIIYKPAEMEREVKNEITNDVLLEKITKIEENLAKLTEMKAVAPSPQPKKEVTQNAFKL